MSACLVLLGILVGCAAPDEQGGTADAWLAEDKIRHFTLSAAATTMGYGAARFALDPEPAWTTAGATALALGVAKEVADVRRGERFSLKDLAWDAAGVALGLALVRGAR